MTTDNRTIGCIGCGSMGSALLCGLALPQQHTLLGYNRSPGPMEALRAVGVGVETDARSLAQKSDIILLAVKPYQVEELIKTILPVLTPEKILVSVAAATPLSQLRPWVAGACPIVRMMPNTTALAGAGIVGMFFDDPLLKDEDKTMLVKLFSGLGQVVVLPESKANQFTAVFACGPAYIFYVMEAIAEAAVSLGFGRAESMEMAASMVHGAGKLAVESGQHFTVLREQVCSPAGVTISAINHLDRTAVRGSVVDAIRAADARAREMGAK